MFKFRVIWEGETLVVSAREGDTILSALQKAGLCAPEAPCGGKGVCGKCLVTVDGEAVLACRTAVTGEHVVQIPEQNKGSVIACEGVGVEFKHSPANGLGAAVDIGTTTVVVHLYDLETGALLGTRSAVNAQRAFGADVISRIQYTSENEEGLTQLSTTIRGQLNEFLADLCAQAGHTMQELTVVVVAANTVMEHLYAGLSASSIAVAPFTPLSLFGNWECGEKFDLPEHTKVYLAPAVAGYVGGDITAGMVACGAYKEDSPVLFLDIGTNGEMALGSAERGFLCCATAAGPAFEGASISQGMTAQDGAISAVEWADGNLAVTVLGGGEAKGICGSGLVDALAAMLEIGAVDETGRLLPPDEAPEAAVPYLAEHDGCVHFSLTETVAITEGDVRQLQLAKAAISAGMAALLEEAGIAEKDLKCLYLAGGFGNYIRKESAAKIGLLPGALLTRIVSVGNSAGLGARAALLSQEAREVLIFLPTKCRYIELSGHKRFNEHYIDNMFF